MQRQTKTPYLWGTSEKGDSRTVTNLQGFAGFGGVYGAAEKTAERYGRIAGLEESRLADLGSLRRRLWGRLRLARYAGRIERAARADVERLRDPQR